MRLFSSLILCGLSALIVSNASAQQAAQPLFNGKNLDGWEGNTALWSVADGVIRGQTTKENPTDGNTFLIWQGGEVTDFVLTLEARITGNNNSGVQYRSKIVDPKKWVLSGYQADMHGNAPYTGMLYEERGRGILVRRGQTSVISPDGSNALAGDPAKAPIDISKWNTYQIEARGNRVIHRVNGEVTIELIDHENSKRSLAGVLGLQLHAGAPMTAEFRNIKLVELQPRTGKPTSAQASKPRSTGENRSGTQPQKPKWIWLSKEPGENETVYFEKRFRVGRGVASATLKATCDNGFTAYLNGEKVLSGDDWGDPKSKNISKHLRKGRKTANLLLIEATNQGSTAGFVAELSLKMQNGRTRKLVSSPNWKSSARKPAGWPKKSLGEGAANAATIGPLGAAPWGDVFAKPKPGSGGGGSRSPKKNTRTCIDASSINTLPGFSAERLYTVPKAEQGSWVSLCALPDGRLISSDQSGALYRIDASGATVKVEKMPLKIGHAQGLLWAFDSLYVVVNGGGIDGRGSGLYRIQDSNGDGELDKITELRRINGGGEHGPHAVVPGPNGKSLYVLGGNHTKLPDPESTVVAPGWREDQLLTRLPDARGHAKGVMAPGGWICRTDPEGKKWELVSTGYRNQYDIAFNHDGEIITYDSDMEWDAGTPWYRPTRICHASSGSEFGWRNGTGKLPVHYPDTLPPVVDIGPGSPTGVLSGKGAKFPERYQRAVYALDWTYGTMYAIHLKPAGSSYTGEKEEFLSGIPLPLTDAVVGPRDGALYFTVGGRGTPSGLYRVTYSGSEPTAPAKGQNKEGLDLRALRHDIESCQVRRDGAVDRVWPHLGHEDRFIRFAARVALEHQPVSTWAAKALAEEEPRTLLGAGLALARQGDPTLQKGLLQALGRLQIAALPPDQQIELLRVYALSFIRMGKPGPDIKAKLAEEFELVYPSPVDAVNRELCSMLVYLGSEAVVAQTIPLMEQDASVEKQNVNSALLARSPGYGPAFANLGATNPQQQQIHYAMALRLAENGWTPELRKGYFRWFQKAGEFKGGASFGGFIDNFRKEALARVTDEKERADLEAFSKEPPQPEDPAFADAPEIRLGVLPGMKFDRDRIEAKAGSKLKLVLVNNDPAQLMHNLILGKPGSREKLVADSLALGAKGLKESFNPKTPEVLVASPVLLPGKSYVMRLTVPSRPGEYPYVCTYPGHGQLMHGIMVVK